MIRLICMDMDGVLVNAHNFWLELHKAFGTLEEGAELTKAYLTTDYAKLVEEVAGRLWRGRDAAPYYALVHAIPRMAGIAEFFRELDRFEHNGKRIPRAIITGGCYDMADSIAKEHGVQFIFANQLVIEGGVTTGEFKWPVGAGGYTKAQIIEQLCDDLEMLPQEVLMIGDSDSDLEAFRICGASIAFNSASERLKAQATYVINSKDLRDLIPVLEKIRESAGVGSPTNEPGAN
jgi:phosphoserine phosphatase